MPGSADPPGVGGAFRFAMLLFGRARFPAQTQQPAHGFLPAAGAGALEEEFHIAHHAPNLPGPAAVGASRQPAIRRRRIHHRPPLVAPLRCPYLTVRRLHGSVGPEYPNASRPIITSNRCTGCSSQGRHPAPEVVSVIIGVGRLHVRQRQPHAIPEADRPPCRPLPSLDPWLLFHRYTSHPQWLALEGDLDHKSTTLLIAVAEDDRATILARPHNYYNPCN